MGDAPLITFISVLPLLVIVFLIVTAFVAWRTKRRAIRTIVAVLIMVIGILVIFSPIGVLFSMGGGIMIVVLGFLLLVLSQWKVS